MEILKPMWITTNALFPLITINKEPYQLTIICIYQANRIPIYCIKTTLVLLNSNKLITFSSKLYKPLVPSSKCYSLVIYQRNFKLNKDKARFNIVFKLIASPNERWLLVDRIVQRSGFMERWQKW